MKFLLNFNSKQVNQNNLNRDTSTKVAGHHMCAGSYDDRNINLQIAEASNHLTFELLKIKQRTHFFKLEINCHTCIEPGEREQ